MIQKVKFPQAVSEQWSCLAERQFSKRIKLRSTPLKNYITAGRLKNILRTLEHPQKDLEAFVNANNLDALFYNEKFYMHPDTLREYIELYFSSSDFCNPR